jgi:hypothetical protein
MPRISRGCGSAEVGFSNRRLGPVVLRATSYYGQQARTSQRSYDVARTGNVVRPSWDALAMRHCNALERTVHPRTTVAFGRDHKSHPTSHKQP